MPATRKPDLLGRIADLGEEAIHRLGDAPGADRLLAALNGLRDRTDELQKRVRGLESLEARLTELEEKVDKLSGTRSRSAKRPAADKPAA